MSKPQPHRTNFEVVRNGLNETTRRELNRPRHWRGLTIIDASLLAIWVRDHHHQIGELHTDVVCGLVPTLFGPLATAANRAAVQRLHPLRIDACAWFMNHWWVLECKPAAGHKAFGQVISYAYWAARGNDRLIDCKLGIITDSAQAIIRPVCDQNRVTLFELYACSP